MLKKILFPNLAKALNAYLLLDPESKTRFTKLKGKTVAIEFLPLSIHCRMHFSEAGIDIKDDDELTEPDTRIRGTPLQLFSMLLAKEKRHRFFAEDLTIVGNAELGQQVIALFDELDIDWEEYLSRVVGDVPTHHLSNLFREIGHWVKNTEGTLSQNINEYIHEEAMWFPTKEALQDFYTEIDNLAMDVDRLEVKFKHLQDKL